MSKIHSPKIPCARPGCKLFAMYDGSGFCWHHNPVMAERRHQRDLKKNETVKKNFTPDKGCQKEGCRRQFGIDAAGFCFKHSPLKIEGRNRAAIKLARRRKEALPEDLCRQEGCKVFPMRDGSGFCFAHNPALIREKIEAVKKMMKTNRTRNLPLEIRCKFKGCKRKAREGDSQLCYSHQPDYRLKMRERMMGKKLHLGVHTPWLGLKDIREAHMLVLYSLETEQPLLTLRALTKIASLYARGEVYIPHKHQSTDPDDVSPPTYFGINLKNRKLPPTADSGPE